MINKIFFILGITMALLIAPHNVYSNNVFERDGCIYFVDKNNKEIRLTNSGRDREPKLHPSGKIVYYVRSFEAELNIPVEDKIPEDGILKDELWKIDVEGKNPKMLFQNSNAPTDHPSGYPYAFIDNIQFSPKGDKVYFESSKWVTSNALNVIDPNGANIKMLGAGNETKIILSTIDSGKDYSGYIVTKQHRYGYFGGSYDWWWLYDQNWKKIDVLGPDIQYVTGIRNIKYTDHSEEEILKDKQKLPVDFPEIDKYLNLKKALNKANENFTFKGKPIHPGLVEEFNSWISDSWMPKTISVDVAASYRSNEYSEYKVKIKDNGYIYREREGDPEYFYYKWLGRLSNGLHVLETGEGGGGSGIFEDIYFVKFELGAGFTPEGHPYPRLLMTVVRKHWLGDRDNGEIKIFPEDNKVILGKSRYRKKSIILEFK